MVILAVCGGVYMQRCIDDAYSSAVSSHVAACNLGSRYLLVLFLLLVEIAYLVLSTGIVIIDS